MDRFLQSRAGEVKGCRLDGAECMRGRLAAGPVGVGAVTNSVFFILLYVLPTVWRILECGQ